MFWAMPDNGFGSKANSRSFLLRVYRVHADFRTARDVRRLHAPPQPPRLSSR